jgi:hypothetical protein
MTIAKNLRIAGILLILGLVVDIISLIWAKPLAFLLFVGVGGLLILAGLFIYLFSLASHGSGSPSPSETPPDSSRSTN